MNFQERLFCISEFELLDESAKDLMVRPEALKIMETSKYSMFPLLSVKRRIGS